MNNKLKSITISLCLFLFIVLNTTNVLAYNPDYLDYANWINNSDTVSENVNVKGAFANLNGSVSYYYDNTNSVYFWISATEKSLTYDENIITLDFTFDRLSNSIDFSVDENGIVQSNSYIDKYFKVASNFVTYTSTKSGDYVVAIDVLNNKEINSITLYATLNGHRYLIFKDETISFEKKQVTTTNNVKNTTNSKVTNNSIKSTTKEKSTKFYKRLNSSTTKVHTTKYKGNNTTKFSAKNYNNVATTVITANNNQSETFVNQLPQAKETLSNKAKYTIIICSITGVIGLALIIVGSILMKIKSKEKEEIIEEIDNFDF